ncbi:MAG: translation elongation factor Ts, partial [Oscillospiraceae bacterium]|nr:translation elongation factor Ts [Oscillospiraceae bacterium]
VVEVNSETDFVANTDQFKGLVNTIAQNLIACNPADVEALKACKSVDSDRTIDEEVQEVFLQIRENIQIRRFTRMEGTLVSYIHGEGRIGVMVKLDTDLGDKALACGKDVALQIAAMNPAYLDRDHVPAEVLENEKNIMLAQMKEDPKMANKPEAVMVKIVEGKVGKYYSENCLVDMEFVKDGDYTVGKYVDKCAKDLGGSIKVAEYVRYERGEGIEKRSDDFAAEVASMMK